MRVLSLNAWCGVLYDALADWLPTCEADVVCLQEVTRTPGLGGWVDFSDAERSLSTRANLFDDVQTLLPDHQGFFVVNDAGPIRVDGATWRQDFGLAVFVHQRHPVIGQTASFIYGSFVDHDEAWAIAERPRLAQGIRIRERAWGRTLSVAHTHGLRDPDGKHDTPARLDQAVRLAAVVDGLRQPEDLTVVCGDLNLLPDSATFEILGRHGLIDLVGTADTRTASYDKPVRHANYLLVSDPAAVVRFETPAEPAVSDHRPLILDL